MHSTVNVASGQGQPTIPGLAGLLENDKPLDRTTVNSWEDTEFLEAVRATGRRKLIFCALWTEVCMAFTALDALREGYDVYPVVDAIGGTSVEAHRAGLERVVRAGGQPISRVSLACELQRDWGRQATVADVVVIVLADRLRKEQPPGWLRRVREAGQGPAAPIGWRRPGPSCAGSIAARPGFDPRRWMTELPPIDLFGALLFQIAGQQLSVAATRRILERIEARFGGRLPSASDVLGADPAQFRDAGLSWRKISSLRDLAGRLSDGRLDPTALATMPDDELIAVLTEIPGIGPWTVRGALIIALGREDVVLPGDLALRKAVRNVYRLDHLPAQEEVLAIAENWRPYRSLGTAYLFSAAFEEAQAPLSLRGAAPSQAARG